MPFKKLLLAAAIATAAVATQAHADALERFGTVSPEHTAGTDHELIGKMSPSTCEGRCCARR